MADNKLTQVDAGQLHATYDMAYVHQVNLDGGVRYNERGASKAHLAGLAAVARQQAEHDAQIARDVLADHISGYAADITDAAISAQFGEETRG